LRYLGVPPTIDAVPPVLVDRREGETVAAGSEVGHEPVVNLVSDVAPGTVPDLHGMSAREAIHRLGTLGWTAQLAGDGFVTSQDPLPGSPLEPGGVCRLVLSRQIALSQQPGQP
jgi:beta-lactam-binding protein with PASTA domain